LTVLQVAMGTQVREMVDFLNHTQGEERSAWVSALPWFFYVHRTFSAVVLFANVWLVWMLYRSVGLHHSLTRLAMGMLAVIVLAIISGATLGHLGMPAIVQPTHLLAAALIFGLQFLLWMDYRHARAV
jgi:cytochrome c oxidase assembly protein subunit 15